MSNLLINDMKRLIIEAKLEELDLSFKNTKGKYYYSRKKELEAELNELKT